MISRLSYTWSLKMRVKVRPYRRLSWLISKRLTSRQLNGIRRAGLWPSYGTEDKPRVRALCLLSSSAQAFVAPNANYMSTVHAPYHERLTVGDGTMRENLLIGLIQSEDNFKNFRYLSKENFFFRLQENYEYFSWFSVMYNIIWFYVITSYYQNCYEIDYAISIATFGINLNVN